MYTSGLTHGTHTAAVVGKKIQVQISWEAQSLERMDEYDMQTKELVTRKWRTTNALGRKRSWEFEIGEQGRGKADQNSGSGGSSGSSSGNGSGGSSSISSSSGNSAAIDLFVSSSNPIFLRRDSSRALIFRVRNLPYSRDVYQISIEDEKQQIVLRTTNKKYFKRFDLPALRRLEIPLDTSALTYDYDSTSKVLIMRYAKPTQLIQYEMEERKRHLSKVSTGEKKEGDVDCKTQ
jgi:protein DPCD